MPTNPLTASTGRFIIRSDSPDQLATFIKDVDVDPDMKLVDSIGPVDHPHTVVVAMSDEKPTSLPPALTVNNKSPSRYMAGVEKSQADSS